MNNPLSRLARVIGTRPGLLRLATVVVWIDHRLHRLSRGRLSLVALAGLPSLRLTTRGRRSGLARATNLLCYPRGSSYVVTGSNWGRPRDPAWTLNLRAHADATVAVRGRATPVRARELTGDEHDLIWAELLDFWPGYAMERAVARRELPIFLLTPSGTD